MREIRINVADQQRALHTSMETGWGHAIIAALMVEPETIEELPQAMARFFRPAPTNLFDNWQPGLCEEDWGEGLLVVDLAARLLVYRPESLEILRSGEFPWHLEDNPSETWLSFAMPDDWRICPYDENWRDVAEQLRTERLASPPLEAREVLYGKLCPYLAECCLRAEDDSLETVRSIHANWLLTPREDLRGKTPRQVLLEKRDAIDSDIERQVRAWSRLGEPPAALGRHTFAYRHAGFGTHENVLYYELVRHLLHAGLTRVGRKAGAANTEEKLRRHLEKLKNQWLNAPQEGLSRRTPAQVMDLERCRLPLEDRHGEEAHGGACHGSAAHDDCPLCQMMTDLPGPSFWFLDGCNMDSGFAFSFFADEEEWEAEESSWREWSSTPRDDLDDEDRESEDALGAEPESVAEPRLWRSSYFNPDFLESTSPGIGIQILLFDIGAKLAELGEDLQGDIRETPWGKVLSGHFANLRAALSDGSHWQIDSARRHLDATIDKIATRRGDLRAKCDDLQRQLDRLQATALQCLQAALSKIETDT